MTTKTISTDSILDQTYGMEPIEFSLKIWLMLIFVVVVAVYVYYYGTFSNTSELQYGAYYY
jgi:hypothetical protein